MLLLRCRVRDRWLVFYVHYELPPATAARIKKTTEGVNCDGLMLSTGVSGGANGKIN